MCVYIRTVQAIKRALILLKDFKKKFLYAIDCETECMFIQSRCTFPCKKKKKEKKKGKEKKNPNKLYVMCID